MPGIPVLIWLLLLVGSIAAEASTRSLVAIWFMPGLLTAVLLAAFGVPLWIQVLLFLILSTLLLLLTRPLVRRLLSGKPEATNADRVIGKEALVTERICSSEGTGQVKVLGQIWSACAEESGCVFEVGSAVSVLRIEGVKLIVKSHRPQ